MRRIVQLAFCGSFLCLCYPGTSYADIRLESVEKGCHCKRKSKKKVKKKSEKSKQTSIGVNVTNNTCGSGCSCGQQHPTSSHPPAHKSKPPHDCSKPPECYKMPPPCCLPPPAFADATLSAQGDPLVQTHGVIPFDTLGEHTDNITFCPSGNTFTIVDGGQYRVHFYVKVETDDDIQGVHIKLNGLLKPIPSVNIVKSLTMGFWGAQTMAYTLTGETIVSLPSGAQISLELDHIPSGISSFMYKDTYIPTSDPTYISLIKIRDGAE